MAHPHHHHHLLQVGAEYAKEREALFAKKTLESFCSNRNIVVLGDFQTPRLPIFSLLVSNKSLAYLPTYLPINLWSSSSPLSSHTYLLYLPLTHNTGTAWPVFPSL